MRTGRAYYRVCLVRPILLTGYMTRTLTTHKLELLLSLVVILLAYFFKPAYEYFCHMGQVPLSPFGWSDVQLDAPITEELYSPDYLDAAN